MNPTGPLATEITYLAWSVILLIVQIVIQASTANRELGLPYNAGPRDEIRRPTAATAGRAERALRNLLETYAAFVGLALALAVTGRTGGLGAAGAAIWFWARVVYVPLYLAGVPYARTLAWTVSAVGLVLMLIRLWSA
jgi:uncharacterized MAPEG superfamily protein